MLNLLMRRRALALAVAAAAASASIAYTMGDGPNYASASGGNPAGGGGIHLFTPTSGDVSGLDSKGFFIDLKADLNVPLDGVKRWMPPPPAGLPPEALA